METTRQNKISRLLQKELSDIFLAETRKTHGIIISVSGTEPCEKNSPTIVFPRRFARLHRKHRFSTEKVNAPYEPPRPENSMALLVFKKIA